MIRTAAVLILLLLVAIPVLGKPLPVADIGFTEQLINTGGNLDYLSYLDITGDGRKDLVLLRRDRIQIYYQKPDRSFPAKPDETLFPGKRMILLDFQDMNANGKVDIVICSPRAVYFLEYDGVRISKKPQLLARTKVDLRPPTEGSFPWVDFVRDFNNDGKPDFWLPVDDGIVFFYGAGGGDDFNVFEQSAVFELEHDTDWALQYTNSRFQTTINYNFLFGKLLFMDFTGNGKIDMVYLLADKIFVYPLDGQGRFGKKNRTGYDLPTEQGRTDIIRFVPLGVADLNGDGLIDIIKTFGDDGMVKIYLGRDKKFSFNRAVQAIREKGWIYSTQLIDLDGDGRLDLFTLQTGVVNWRKALRIFMSGKTTIYAQVYLNRSKRGKTIFSEHHDYIEAFTNPLVFEIDISGVKNTDTRIFINAWYDFNNDGKKDIFALSDDRQVSIYFAADRKGFYGNKPDFNLTIHDASPYNKVREYIGDLDGDGRQDFMLHFQNDPGEMDVVGIYFSVKTQ
ncbi:FG-GAP repeat domain-containing protein [Planctomycetota bacterium]